VIGQASFTVNTAVASQAGLGGPFSVLYEAVHNRLFVGDLINKRVLIFSGSMLSTGMNANTVLGQVDFTSTAENVTQTGMRRPNGLSYDSTTDRLYVTDYSYNRVMVFGFPIVVASVPAVTPTVTAPTEPIQSGGGRRGSSPVTSPSLFSHPLSSAASLGSSSSSGQASAASSPGSTLFSDVPPSSWFASSVSALMKAGIVSGYNDLQGNPTGAFKPANDVTQAEILKMALLAAGKSPKEGIPKNLSARGDWSAPYVHAAEDLGLSVYGPSLDIHLPATRGQVVQTVLEAFGIPIARGDNPFHDLPSSSPFAAAMETAAKLQIIQGDTDAQGNAKGTVRPTDPINRAEVSKIVELMRER
jgi:hypothetical protein